MRMSRFFAALGAVAMLTGCDDKPPTPVRFTAEMQTDAVSQEAVSAALAAFAESCKPLTTKYWGSVVEAKAVVAPVPDYAPYLLAKGWTYQIEVEITLADETSIPATDEYGVPDRQHLWYNLGGGHTPGFFAAKRVSQFLCGMPVDQNGVKVFRDLPALKILP